LLMLRVAECPAVRYWLNTAKLRRLLRRNVALERFELFVERDTS